MAWKVEIPYDRESPYYCDDSSDAAEIIVQSDQYQSNYEYDRDSFDEYLDDCYGEVEICGASYWSSSALKDVDASRYDDWYSEECYERARDSKDEVEYDLDHNEFEGGNCWFYGNITATYYEQDEDEEDDEGHDQDEVFDCFQIAT